MPQHITQRGNNRQDVFNSTDDRKLYLKLLNDEATRHNVRVLGWCLMTNHVHLILIPDDGASLALALGHAHSQYALAFNRSKEKVGHLWQNRFHSCTLQASHLIRALRYVELNPVRAGLAGSALDWPWSSARAHVLHGLADPLMGGDWPEWFRGWDYAGWKECLGSDLADGELQTIRRATRTGEPFGTGEFLRELEQQLGKSLHVGDRGRPKKQSKPLPCMDHPRSYLFHESAL
jgi:putative transposase